MIKLKNGDLVIVKDTGLVAPLHIGAAGVVVDDTRSTREVRVSHAGGILWWSIENLELINESD